jgi:hypothetical protein
VITALVVYGACFLLALVFLLALCMAADLDPPRPGIGEEIEAWLKELS